MCRSKNAEAVIINVDAKMNELGRRLEDYRQGDALRDLQSTDSVIVDCIGPRIDEIRVLPYKGSQEIVEWLPEHGLTTGQMNNFRKWWPLAGCDDSRVDRVSAGYKSEPFKSKHSKPEIHVRERTGLQELVNRSLKIKKIVSDKFLALATGQRRSWR